MTRASKGFRSGTRRRLAKPLRLKFKPAIFLREFKPKDKVVINMHPAQHKSMPFPRFKGLSGVIVKKINDSYKVSVNAGGKRKYIITKPEHLKLIE